MNELGICPTRSDNAYFANNEQESLAFTDFVLHVPNII